MCLSSSPISESFLLIIIVNKNLFCLSPALRTAMSSTTVPDLNVGDGRSGSFIRNLDTVTAYNLWSEVYDTDGNFLQALDTREMPFLLPQMLSRITSPAPWKIVDLGCGTGRNTSELLTIPDATIFGLDASPKMLDIARSKLSERMTTPNRPCQGSKDVTLGFYNMLSDCHPPNCALNADAVISTLVLEHIPLHIFFKSLSQVLKSGGIALVTNMHSEMGNISQAGFVDPLTGEKVRPQSYAHHLDDIVAEARRQGFEITGDVIERSVDDAMSKKLGERSKKWIGVTVWFALLLRKHGYDG